MSLRLPFVVWTVVPSHEITCMTSSQDGRFLVTGTSTGTCCKWIRDPMNPSNHKLLPQILFIPSSCSASVSIVIVVIEDTEFLVSCLLQILLSICFLLFSISPNNSTTKPRYLCLGSFRWSMPYILVVSRWWSYKIDIHFKPACCSIGSFKLILSFSTIHF